MKYEIDQFFHTKGLLLNLEEDLRSVFIRDASAVYLSRELSSFERLLLHAICQYYLLKSCSE